MSDQRIREGSVLLAAFLALGACGSDPEPLPPSRVRLTEATGTLHAASVPAATELLHDDFADVSSAWTRAFDREKVLDVDPAHMSCTPGTEAGRSFVTLSGAQGALYRVVAVEPGTPVLFEGELRARDLAPHGLPFTGATFWVAELSAHGTPAELFGAGGGPFVALHSFPTVAGVSGWQTRRAFFRTRPETRAVLVSCMLSLDEALEGGAVDFDRVALSRISERELWELGAARAVAVAHRGDALPDAADWRARRRVDAMLAGEQRPSLLCLPGERLELEVDVPRGAARFEAGLAPWPAAFRGAGKIVFTLRVGVGKDGGERLRRELVLAPELAAVGWTELALDLASEAGKRVTLELGVEGDVPAVLGAPELVAPEIEAAGWNVLLVSIDTLRADRVGAYGATSGATPRIDALAQQSLVFEDVTANAPYTLPAHASLFSGQFPTVHAVEDQGRTLAPSRSPVLARILAAQGFRTQAFTAAGFLTSDFGFHAGFDSFAITDPLRHPGSKFFRELRAAHPAWFPAALEDPAREPGVEGVRRWLGAHARERFFLFLHTYEVHDYDPPPGTLDCAKNGCTSKLVDHGPLTLRDKNRTPLPGTPEDRAHLGHLYDAALRHVDAEVGLLLDDLARLGLAERTLVVVTSDHGEELFERGFLQHGKSLHREVLRIPLIVRVPGRAPARVKTPAMQVDVAPTLLAALGLPRDPRMQGRDLLASGGAPRPIWSEVHDVRAHQASLRDGAWKLVRGSTDPALRFPSANEWELYDLAHDPEERTDLAAKEPARLADLQRALAAFQALLDAAGDEAGPLPSAEVDDGTRQLLDALGY